MRLILSILISSLFLLHFSSCVGKDEFSGNSDSNNDDSTTIEEEENEDSDIEVPAMVSGAFLTCSFTNEDYTEGGCAMKNADQSNMNIEHIEKEESWVFAKWENGEKTPLNDTKIKITKLSLVENVWQISFKTIDNSFNIEDQNSGKYLSVTFNKQYTWSSLNIASTLKNKELQYSCVNSSGNNLLASGFIENKDAKDLQSGYTDLLSQDIEVEDSAFISISSHLKTTAKSNTNTYQQIRLEIFIDDEFCVANSVYRDQMLGGETLDLSTFCLKPISTGKHTITLKGYTEGDFQSHTTSSFGYSATCD